MFYIMSVNIDVMLDHGVPPLPTHPPKKNPQNKKTNKKKTPKKQNKQKNPINNALTDCNKRLEAFSERDTLFFFRPV